MSRKTVLLLSVITAGALTMPATAQVTQSATDSYGYPTAQTVDAGFNTVEEEAAAIRRYQESLQAPAQQYAQPVQQVQTTQTYEYPLAKTYSSREAALADIQIEIFDTPIPQNSPAAREVTYGQAYTQSAVTTAIQAPSYSYAPATTYGTSSTYTVSQGETLYGISRKYGLKPSDLMNANGLTDSTIGIGQVLTIPSASIVSNASYTQTPSYSQTVTTASSISAPQTTVIRNVAPLPSAQQYGVLPGDTLSSIARRYCLTPSAIAAASGIATTDTLMPGDMLSLPAGNCAK